MTLELPLLFFLPLPASKQQLYSVCKNMQTRVVELIPQLVDEGFIEELLVVNDDLNNAFIRYERCVGAFLAGLKELYCRFTIFTCVCPLSGLILTVLLSHFRFDRLNKAQVPNIEQVTHTYDSTGVWMWFGVAFF